MLKKYFGISSAQTFIKEAPMLVVATFLDPRTKNFSFAAETWRNELTTFCYSYLNKWASTVSEPTDSLSSTILSEIYSQTACSFEKEFSCYRSIPVANARIDEEEYLLNWWRSHSFDYPTLAKAAKEILAVPASSAPAERIFSKTKLLATEKRTKLSGTNFSYAAFIACNKDLISFFD